MHTDVLTGLGNSRQFSEEPEKLDDAMQKEDFRDYVVIVVDANNLKYINDSFGHEKGDVYIKGCAGVLSRSCEKDIICRTGGDEFVALFIGDNAAYRARAAEVRLTSEYYDSSTADAEPWEKYSASVGLAFCEKDDMHFTDVLKWADKRMYEAKMKHKEKYGSYR